MNVDEGHTLLVGLGIRCGRNNSLKILYTYLASEKRVCVVVRV